jgi:hypothetical protein
MDVAEWTWYLTRFGGRLSFTTVATAMRAGFENGRTGFEQWFYRPPASGMRQ